MPCSQNGFLSSLPYIGFWLAINVSGQLFDFLQSKSWLSTTAARKISNSIGKERFDCCCFCFFATKDVVVSKSV